MKLTPDIKEFHCNKCNTTKPVDAFPITHRKQLDKYEIHPRCRSCKQENDRKLAKIKTLDGRGKNASAKYRQTEKYKDFVKKYFGEKDPYSNFKGQSWKIESVECKGCGKHKIYRGGQRLPKNRILNCCIGIIRYKKSIIEVKCINCGIIHKGKGVNSRCNNCRLIKKRKDKIKERAQHRNHKSRAIKYGVYYEPVNRYNIFERDDYTCVSCGIKVVLSLTWRPNMATIDHIIPMSKGGAHIDSNLQTMCSMCNIRKSDKIPQAPL